MKKLDNVSIVLVCGVSDDEHISSSLKALKYSCSDLDFYEKILISPKIDNKEILNEIKNLGISHHIIDGFDYIGYNNFMIKNLYDHISSDFCISIQHDGFIVNSSLWDDDFLNYDYIGAPWKNDLIQYTDSVFPDVKNSGKYSLVGNGGFSLRSKKLLYETKCSPFTCDIQKINNFSLTSSEVGEHVKMHMPEDNYISLNYWEYFKEKGIKYAPVDLAGKFSMEYGQGQTPINQVFGFHGDRILVSRLLK